MSQRQEWIDALQGHQREMERLTRALREFDEAASRRLVACAERDECARRQIEYATAQMIRHKIRMALISSRLATPLSPRAEDPPPRPE
ncbi:MAG TPA: hypothetical protein VLY46_05200 [Usitatibacter sp.]|nr:hypothetical protein [Usitatibacter sp.]